MEAGFAGRVSLAFAVSLALCAAPGSAAAADRDACIQAYVDAQSARKNAELLRAQQALALCADESCPGMVRRDCAAWLDEVSRAVPSVILRARDEHERDLLDVTVTVDDRRLPMDGRPVPLDPGQHRVRFERAGAASQEQVVLLAEGERARFVTVTFPSGASAAPRPDSAPVVEAAPVPVATWVLGGVGVVSLGVFTYFAVRGADDRVTLGCDRACSSSSYAHVNGELNVADVTLGVGVVSLGVAAIWWLVSRRAHGVQAQPTVSGLRLTGSF